MQIRSVVVVVASLVLLVVVSARLVAAQDTGFIQVQCEPGIQIFLDGTLEGLSNSDQGGLVIEAVPVGEWLVKALKPGFTPQERRVRVAKRGEIVVVKFEVPTPKAPQPDEAAAPRVTSTPNTSEPSSVKVRRETPETSVVDLGGGVTMNMVAIKPGRFVMGSPSGEGSYEERPAHPVEITQPFWLGQTEVTQAQWQAVMGNNPSFFNGPDRPVETVSWNDATEFCKRLSDKTGMTFRLPTEAEWEYACRGGTTTAYSFGESEASLAEFAWFDLNSQGSTRPVATRKPNPWGLYDMHGNVREWVADWYGLDYYRSSPIRNPPGPDSGEVRVLRGGGWFCKSYDCRSSCRGYETPVLVYHTCRGFRAARTP